MNVLGPLLRGEPASFQGEEYRVNAALDVPGASDTPVVIAALGDLMLKIAGETAAGTILWMTGPATIEDHIGPKLRAAASDAGRPEPRIVAGFPIALTPDVPGARKRLGRHLELYGQLPSYRAMLDLEQLDHPADIAMLGDEAALRARLQQLRDIGVTDFNAFCFDVDEGAAQRTMAFLAGEKANLV